jgi:hypothetical protein
VLSWATNETSHDFVVSRVLEAFKTFEVLLINQDGVVSAQIDKTRIQRIDDEMTSNKNDKVSDDLSIYFIGIIIGCILASVAVIVSFFCIIKGRVGTRKRLGPARSRGQREKRNSLSSKPGCQTTEYVLKGSINSGTASTVSTPPRSQSVVAGDFRYEQEKLTAWTSNEALFSLNHPVYPDSKLQHVCIAPTCRIYEIQRQESKDTECFASSSASSRRCLNPPTPPRSNTSYTREKVVEPHSAVYDDLRRWYMFDDTVEL